MLAVCCVELSAAGVVVWAGVALVAGVSVAGVSVAGFVLFELLLDEPLLELPDSLFDEPPDGCSAAGAVAEGSALFTISFTEPRFIPPLPQSEGSGEDDSLAPPF